MPSTLFPLPVSTAQLRGSLTGLQDTLDAYTDMSGLSEEDWTEQMIREAQGEIEALCGLDFFITRYCTEEIAAYPDPANASATPLVIGTDYDRIHQPLDYVVNDWQAGTGRLVVPRRPIHSVDLYRMTFSQGGQIVDIPLGWLNNNAMTGVLQLMPHGLGVNATEFFRLMLMFPYYQGAPQGTIVPNLIHLRYQAGLVDPASYGATRSDWEEAAVQSQKETKWDQGLVQRFQRAIIQHAAGAMLREVLNELDGGGASISFAGLSETVNPQVLQQRADLLQDKALRWARDTADYYRGPLMVTI